MDFGKMEEGKKWRLKVQVIIMVTLAVADRDTLLSIRDLHGLKDSTSQLLQIMQIGMVEDIAKKNILQEPLLLLIV